MAIAPSAFRTDFPEFANVIKYPDSMINTWATVAPILLDEMRWGDLFTLGQELFIAHNLVLDGMAGAEAARGGLVGFAKGPVASEGGDKVSVSYAVTASMEEGAGHWNMSTFGMRYWSIMQLVGMGVVQAGANPLGGIIGPYGWGRGGPTNMQF